MYTNRYYKEIRLKAYTKANRKVQKSVKEELKNRNLPRNIWKYWEKINFKLFITSIWQISIISVRGIPIVQQLFPSGVATGSHEVQ